MGVVAAASAAVSWFAGAASIAFTYTGFYVATYGLVLAGAVVLASALKPKIPDGGIGGQGQILNTTKSNTEPLPVVYGWNRLGGNIVWQTTNNHSGGTTNKDYFSIICLADGESYDFYKMFVLDNEMEEVSAGVFTTEYVHVKTYTTSGDGIILQDVDFCTDDTGTIESGLSIFGEVSVTSSSFEAGNTLVDNVVDGNESTFWQPDTSEDEWIEFYSGVTAEVSQVKMILRDISYSGWTYDYEFTIQYSDNGSTWTDGSDVYTSNAGGGQSWVTVATNETAGHAYWRVYFTKIERVASFGGGTEAAHVFEMDVTSNVTQYISLPSSMTYIAMHQIYDATDTAHVQLSNVTAELKGKLIQPFTSNSVGSEVFSSSPAAVVFDIMKDRLNITENDIDIPSFYNAQTFADDNLLQCNIVYAQQQNTASAIENALATMRAHVSYSNGKWKIIQDKAQSALSTLDTSDILQGSLNVSMTSNSELANKIILKYINPDDAWQIASVEHSDELLLSIDGQANEHILEVKGCTSREQAYKLAELTLNKMRFSENSDGARIAQTPLSISFTTTLKNAHIEVGDVYGVDHPLLNFERNFQITSVETDMSGVINIEATEHCDTHYRDTAGNYIIQEGGVA